MQMAELGADLRWRALEANDEAFDAEEEHAGGGNGSGGHTQGLRAPTRPTSSKEVTPTPTPGTPSMNAAGGRSPQPHAADAMPAPGRFSSRTGGASPARRGTSRIVNSGTTDGAPPVLRQLRMPKEPELAETAAEILQL